MNPRAAGGGPTMAQDAHNEQAPAVGTHDPLVDLTHDVADFVAAQQAIGATWPEAVAVASDLFGVDAVLPAYRDWTRGADPRSAVAVLKAIAKTSPMGANALLGHALSEGSIHSWKQGGQLGIHLDTLAWVRSLPMGLKVQGTLYLVDCRNVVDLPNDLDVEGDVLLDECVSLTTLPSGMRLGGTLSLECIRGLVRLPSGLRVGQSLFLSGCTSWDGRIPDDAHIGDKMFTETHPAGISLDEWRQRHPGGER